MSWGNSHRGHTQGGNSGKPHPKCSHSSFGPLFWVGSLLWLSSLSFKVHLCSLTSFSSFFSVKLSQLQTPHVVEPTPIFRTFQWYIVDKYLYLHLLVPLLPFIANEALVDSSFETPPLPAQPLRCFLLSLTFPLLVERYMILLVTRPLTNLLWVVTVYLLLLYLPFFLVLCVYS